MKIQYGDIDTSTSEMIKSNPENLLGNRPHFKWSIEQRRYDTKIIAQMAYVFSSCLIIVYDANKPLKKKNVSTEMNADIMNMLWYSDKNYKTDGRLLG